MIPKIIHTCWFSKDEYFQLNKTLRQSIESWKKYCPDYKIKVWTLSDWIELESYPFAEQCLSAGIASYAYLSDLFKFWVLYNHGGWYIESDVILKNSLDDFVLDSIVFGEDKPDQISGTVIASKKNHPLIKSLLDKISSKIWINKDNSLNIYQDTSFIGNEIKKSGYDFPNNISEKIIIKGVSFCPQKYFSSSSLEQSIYSYHIGKSSHQRKISIVMPIYNSEKYLKEAINSILNQDFEDFELLCIDDGSTDSSANIINSYVDDRIVYIRKDHSGIVDSLNIGLRRAVGTYIVRMDSDDIMLQNRLSHQYSYMELHPEIDILGSGFMWGNGKEIPEYFKPAERKISLKNLRAGNLLAHPATIIRKSSILKLPYWYENYFQGCEDYKLWAHAIHHGLNVHTEPTPVIIYRQHSDQETSKSDYFDKITPIVNQIQRIYIKYLEETPKEVELTCIIPFQNEGSEIERTVANIRGTAGANVKIILINDASTDNYDYKWIADNYSCKYLHNNVNLGVAGSRDLGVENCETEYFVLLDGHMRFYHDNWHIKLLEALKNNPDCLVTSNTVVFSYDKETKIYKNEEGSTGRNSFGSYGAFINMSEPGWEFTGKWTSKIMEGYDKDSEIIPISCCMGAVYAASKTYWNKLGGLQGLTKYGSDEPLISLKTWMAGGKVLLMKNWGVGHLYRGTSPYTVPMNCLDQNQIYIINLVCTEQDQIDHLEHNLKTRVGEQRFIKAKALFEEKRESFEKFKKYFHEEVVQRSLNWFLNEINEKCYYK